VAGSRRDWPALAATEMPAAAGGGRPALLRRRDGCVGRRCRRATASPSAATLIAPPHAIVLPRWMVLRAGRCRHAGCAATLDGAASWMCCHAGCAADGWQRVRKTCSWITGIIWLCCHASMRMLMRLLAVGIVVVAGACSLWAEIREADFVGGEHRDGQRQSAAAEFLVKFNIQNPNDRALPSRACMRVEVRGSGSRAASTPGFRGSGASATQFDMTITANMALCC